MQYNTFGRTGWQVSEIAFGAWQLGGTWGDISDQEAISTLVHAFGQGINFVDTAAAYGNGRSETLVGKAVAARKSEDIFVATKVLPRGVVDGEPDLSSIKNQYPTDYLTQQIDDALVRLDRDHIDLLQLHLWIEDGTRNFDWLEGAAKALIDGKIRAIGVSLPDIQPETGVALAKTGLVSSIQVLFNIFEQAPRDALFPAGKHIQTAFIGRVPLDSGSLSGTWNNATYAQWSKSDKRSEMYRGGRFEETLNRVEAVKEVCAPYFENLAEAALRYCLSEHGISTIACGMRNQTEVDMNVAFSDGGVFPSEMRQALEGHAWRHSFYQ